MKTLAILQARMTSTRLPGKVMMKVNGSPMIHWQSKRILEARKIDHLIIATSIDKSDDSLFEFMNNQGFSVYRGSLVDVFSRYLEISNIYKPASIVRLTGDCPLVMPELIDEMLERFDKSNVDYLSNTLEATFPDGLDIEIFKTETLEKLSSFSLTETEKEHVTYGIYQRPESFTLANFNHSTNLGTERWTVDYAEDLDFIRQIFSHFVGMEESFNFQDVLELLERNPEIRSSIPGNRRNESLEGNRHD